MQDLTEYGDGELSNHFLNTECLYNHMVAKAKEEVDFLRPQFKSVKEMAEEIFIFTPDQLTDLEETYDAEVAEYQSEEDEAEKEAKKKEFIIDLDERGEFKAHVENDFGRSIYEIEGDSIFEDGFMKDKKDMKGLKDYLVSLGIMQEDETIEYKG